MLKLLAVIVLVILIAGIVIGAIGASAANDVSNQAMRRRLPSYEEAAEMQRAQRKLEPRRSFTELLFGPRAAPPLQRVGSAAKLPPAGKPTPPGAVPRPKRSRFATRTPEEQFAAVCACPSCGWCDTHFLRAPTRPPAPQPAPEQSWWDWIVGWFGDDKPEPVRPPKADHPDAAVVRTCRNCGHVWAQK